jgi:5-methylcytosine-specific restriction endonuclease McrA
MARHLASEAHMPRSLGRTGHRWRKLCEQVKSEEAYCWICKQYINPYCEPRSPMSYSVDHILPIQYYPELALERGNVHAAHLRCNVIRSNTRWTRQDDVNSRNW